MLRGLLSPRFSTHRSLEQVQVALSAQPRPKPTNGAMRLVGATANRLPYEHKISWNAKGLQWQGVYVAGTTCLDGDAVNHDGSSCIAAVANTHVTPGTNARVRLLLAASGDDGDTGPAGPQGATVQQAWTAAATVVPGAGT